MNEKQEEKVIDPCFRRTYSMSMSSLSQLNELEKELYGSNTFNKSQVLRDAILFYYKEKILSKKTLKKKKEEYLPGEENPLEDFKEDSHGDALLDALFEEKDHVEEDN